MRLCSFAAFALLVCSSCKRGDPLSEQLIVQAEQAWKRQSKQTYELQLNISGDRIENGEFVVQIQNAKQTTATRNGQSFVPTDDFYTMPGLIRFLRSEMDMAKRPQQYFGAKDDAQVHQRLKLDSKGLLKRYFRAVYGTQHSIEIDVVSVR